MADEQQKQATQDKEPELRRPDEAVEDLEPDKHEGDEVKGGYIFQKYKDGTD